MKQRRIREVIENFRKGKERKGNGEIKAKIVCVRVYNAPDPLSTSQSMHMSDVRRSRKEGTQKERRERA